MDDVNHILRESLLVLRAPSRHPAMIGGINSAIPVQSGNGRYRLPPQIDSG